MEQEQLQAELEAEIQAGTIVRDANGRFKPGNPGGPGRPRIQTHVAFFNAVEKHLTPQALDEIILATVEAAKCGDGRAREAIIKLLTAKQGSVRDWEIECSTDLYERAQAKIDAKYNLSNGKKKSPFDFEPIDFL
jgi:hypothetical protein